MLPAQAREGASPRGCHESRKIGQPGASVLPTDGSDTTVPGIKPQIQRAERRAKLSTLRKSLAKRLVSAKNETAMLTTFNEVNMQAVMDLRKKYRICSRKNMKLTLDSCPSCKGQLHSS